MLSSEKVTSESVKKCRLLQSCNFYSLSHFILCDHRFESSILVITMPNINKIVLDEACMKVHVDTFKHIYMYTILTFTSKTKYTIFQIIVSYSIYLYI